jgi:hypothetical protein
MYLSSLDDLDGMSIEHIAYHIYTQYLLLSRRDAIISSRGIAPGSEHQEPKTAAVRTDSSESECRIFETVRPPREKARSASVDVAAK